MKEETRKKLEELGEVQYRDFSAALIPESKPLIGIRLPELRRIAKEQVKQGSWKEQLDSEDVFFEEVMLRGMMIGYGTSRADDIEEAFTLLDSFAGSVDNWSVCDSCCVSFDIFERYREETWQHIQKYLYSDKEFEVRVGLILLLDHFLKCDDKGGKLPRKRCISVQDMEPKSTAVDHIGDDKGKTAADHAEHRQDTDVCGLYVNRILDTLNREFLQGYYAQMAAAWLTAECFVTFPQKTWRFLRENKMDAFTYNKALQKICESRTPDEQVKMRIRSLKRK